MKYELAPTKRVFKYPFSMLSPKFSLFLPKDFKFLTVAFQGDTPNLWAEVTDLTTTEEFHFQVFGTGHDIPVDDIWLGTFYFGPYVYHLYQITSK
jgi:hypothetical protein